MYELPHNIDAERALLGGLLQEPERLDALKDTLKPEHFFRPDHAHLYSFLIAHTAREGGRFDLVTLPQYLAQAQMVERCGGIGYILSLPDFAPTTVNLDHYADVIRETAGRRQIIRIAGDLQRAAVSDGDPVGVLVERAVKTLAEAGVLGQTGSWVRISEVLDEEFQRIDSMAREGEGPGGLPTGLDKLTEELGGMRPGQLIVLAARPGMGKTALALNVAQYVSLLPDHPAVAIFSLEMTRQELVGRMMSSHTEIDARRLREGRSLVESEWELLEAKLEELRPTRVYIDDTPSLSIGEVKARCRKLKADDPSLALIVIDYLQLMRGDDHRAQRIQQVGEISQGLKALAKDVRVPVIALSQLNRSVESRQDKRPVLSDLRESGAIEQDADVILFIYRDDYYNKDSDCPGQAEVIIAKQRAGNTGTVRVVWEAPIQRFSSLFEGAVLR